MPTTVHGFEHPSRFPYLLHPATSRYLHIGRQGSLRGGGLPLPFSCTLCADLSISLPYTTRA